MIKKRYGILVSALILLAISACQPAVNPESAVSPEPAQPEIEAGLATVVPGTATIDAIPLPTSQPTEEQTMPEDPTDPPPTATALEPTESPEEQQTEQDPDLPTPDPAVHGWILFAMEDLAQRLMIATSQIEVLSFVYKVWPDASLGCPQPGMGYTQVVQDGYLIILSAGGETYRYHGGGDRGSDPFLCEQPGPEIVITKNAPLESKSTPTKSVPPPRD